MIVYRQAIPTTVHITRVFNKKKKSPLPAIGPVSTRNDAPLPSRGQKKNERVKGSMIQHSSAPRRYVVHKKTPRTQMHSCPFLCHNTTNYAMPFVRCTMPPPPPRPACPPAHYMEHLHFISHHNAIWYSMVQYDTIHLELSTVWYCPFNMLETKFMYRLCVKCAV